MHPGSEAETMAHAGVGKEFPDVGPRPRLPQTDIATILVAKVGIMTERISTLDVRQRLGDMLNPVALRDDEFVIERKGMALAALVPVEKLEQMRRIARHDALAFLDHQKGGGLNNSKAAELALAAQGWARKAGKKK